MHGSYGKKTMALATMVFLVGSLAWAPAAQASEDQGCNNYGIILQQNVAGDNSYNCIYQYCHTGAAGSGSAGVGVGTGASEGEAGAQASAGTGCGQDANQTGGASGFGPFDASLVATPAGN